MRIFSNALVRQMTEAALQSSESRHRAILKALPDLTFIISPEGLFLDYSGDSSQLLVPAEEFLGRRIEEVLPADVAARLRAAFAQVSVTGHVVEVEYEMSAPRPAAHLRGAIGAARVTGPSA